MTLNQALSKLRAARSLASARAGELRRLLAETEQWQFLRYYYQLRLDALRGRATPSQPLGLGFRWRQWQYERYMRRIKQREWLG